jgi:apolipoprotein N-acyltransferase
MSQSTMSSPVMPAQLRALKVLPKSSPPSPRIAALPWLLAAATAGLLGLSYFPVSCGMLAWVALVPLLCLVRMQRRWTYLSAYACGVLFFGASLQWMRVADPRMYATWIALTFYIAVYFPLGIYFLRVLDQLTPLPLTLTLPVVWTALEWFRSTFITGFGWYMLAHSQHDYLPLIQISDITGAYGVTFIVAAVNGLFFESLWRHPSFRRALRGHLQPSRDGRVSFLIQAAGVAALLAATLGYGWYRLGQDHFAAGPRVALLQGNIDQRLRNEAMVAPGASIKVRDHYVYLTDAARELHPHLIVWPETALPYDWQESKPGEPGPSSQHMADDMAQRWQVPILLGTTSEVYRGTERPRRYNSAVLVGPAVRPTTARKIWSLAAQAALQQPLAAGPAPYLLGIAAATSPLHLDGRLLGRYDKSHLVVFGEYVPLRDWLPFMNKLAPYDFDYSVTPGESFTRFALPHRGRELLFGVVICFEDTDPDLSQPYAGSDRQPAVDFLLNISNDGWFDGTSEHDEHLAICRFRAVECRRAVGRSVNMGISAIIDGNGRVLAPEALPVPSYTLPTETHLWKAEAVPGAPGLPLRQWADYKKVHGVLLAVVPLDERYSFYAQWGNWLPWSCMAVLVIVLGCRFAQWRGERTVSQAGSGK